MYRIFLPTEPLRPYIDNYWVLRAPHPIVLQENVFVDGKADILFNFGCAYERHTLGQTSAADSLARSNLDGQRKFPVGILQQGAVHLVGVRFKAGGLAAFVRLPLNEISNQTVQVGDIFGAAADELEGRLYASPVEAQIGLLDSFFLRHLQLPGNYVMTLRLARMLASAVDDVRQSAPSDARIWQLCRDAGYSFRSVDRFFRQFFGISPKFYARVLRFQNALALLPHERLGLAEIAVACGYYDQAHLTKEFQAFAAQTPTQYRGHLREKAAAPPPNLAQFLQEQKGVAEVGMQPHSVK